MKTTLIGISLVSLIAASQAAVDQESRLFRIAGPVPTTITAIAPDGTIAWTNVATNATFTVQTVPGLSDAFDWVDYICVPASNDATVHRVFDLSPPPGMALIPAGSFIMGDNSSGSPLLTAIPTGPAHTVQVSAFYMDRYEITKGLWDEVYQWAIAHGYSFESGASGKAANHPAHSMTWYDVVKWCNARSEKEGLVPAYYTSAEQTTVYRSGQVDVRNDWVKWNAGYRLPTEAEWEKAARGGLAGQQFPWGSNTITHSEANYYSNSQYDFDISPTRGYHPAFFGDFPYTSPVGYFAPNGYGLYDMAGNVWEWCWDWVAPYSSATQIDPLGPDTPSAYGSYRVGRGGSWVNQAFRCRAADRGNYRPDTTYISAGLRCARGAGQ